MGGKRTCRMCFKKFYKAELVSRKMSYWCLPCWKKRQARIKKGDKVLRVYPVLWKKITRTP